MQLVPRILEQESDNETSRNERTVDQALRVTELSTTEDTSSNDSDDESYGSNPEDGDSALLDIAHQRKPTKEEVREMRKVRVESDRRIFFDCLR